MLTSFPHAPLFRASPSSLPRRKGAQPGNHNAFLHGLYSAHSHSARLTPEKTAYARKDPAVLQKELQESLVASCKKGLREDRRILAQCLARSKPGTPLKGILSQVRAATLVTGRILKIERYLFELGGRQEHIRSLARNVPVLLRWEFSELGIPPRPAFVPRKLKISHANLNWEAPRLLDAQWQLLEETLTAQRADMDYFRKYRRRKPLPSARFLLEGILWKLANGLRWHDLEGKYPVRRCQELYTALVRSGRMQTVYNRLLGFLNAHGSAGLEALVERGCFVISSNRVLLATGEKPGWEKYTALLLLQQANRARRSIIRSASDRERRCRGGYYRLRLPREPGPLGPSIHQSPQPRPPMLLAWPINVNAKGFPRVERNLKIRETESVGRGFLYGKIRRSKIQRKPDP